MKTTFYLVRHGRSVANERGIVQGVGLSVPLSADGIAQAAKLAERMRQVSFDVMYTSKAVRAIDTAKPLRALFPQVPYEECAELNERSKGEAEGMLKTEFKETYPDIEAAWAREEDPRVPGGESFADVEDRMMPLLKRHAEMHSGKTVLYVGHGNTFRVVIGAILDAPAGLRSRIAQDYCAMSVIEYDHERGRWSVLKVNTYETL